MELYKVSKRAYRYYIENTKGNEGTPFELAQKKLTRNIKRAVKVHLKKNEYIYLYGNLHIYTKGNKVVRVVNHWEENDWFYKNMKEWGKLNKQLGIDNFMDQWNEVGDVVSHVKQYARGISN